MDYAAFLKPSSWAFIARWNAGRASQRSRYAFSLGNPHIFMERYQSAGAFNPLDTTGPFYKTSSEIADYCHDSPDGNHS